MVATQFEALNQIVRLVTEFIDTIGAPSDQLRPNPPSKAHLPQSHSGDCRRHGSSLGGEHVADRLDSSQRLPMCWSAWWRLILFVCTVQRDEELIGARHPAIFGDAP